MKPEHVNAWWERKIEGHRPPFQHLPETPAPSVVEETEPLRIRADTDGMYRFAVPRYNASTTNRRTRFNFNPESGSRSSGDLRPVPVPVKVEALDDEAVARALAKHDELAKMGPIDIRSPPPAKRMKRELVEATVDSVALGLGDSILNVDEEQAALNDFQPEGKMSLEAELEELLDEAARNGEIIEAIAPSASADGSMS